MTTSSPRGTLPWWWPGAVALAVVLGLSLFQPSLAMHRDIRFEAIASLVDLDRTYVGDPQPAIVAAARLARDPRAPLYRQDLSTGSSFIYPPLAALLYRPLADLPQDDARRWLAAANHALFVIIVALMAMLASAKREAGAWLVAACVLAAVAFYPLVHAVQLNQATLVVTACLGGAWLALEEDRQALAGALFAAAFAIKPQLLLALPALAWGARRMVASALLAGALLLLASLAYAGWANHLDYVTRVLPSLSRGYAYYANQGLNGLLYRLIPGEDIRVFQQVPDSGVVRWSTRVAVLVVLSASMVLGRRWRARSVPVSWTLAVAWLAATLASPVAWQHHYAPALFAFVALGRALRDDAELRRPLVAALACVSFALMAAYFEVRQLEGVAARLLASYVFYGAVVLGAALVVAGETCAARR